MSAIIIGREEQDNELPPPTPVLRAAALSTLQTPASRRQELDRVWWNKNGRVVWRQSVRCVAHDE